jgi:hypothetical protein
MIQFRQKDFNLKTDILKGATVGGTLGGIATKIPGFRGKFEKGLGTDLMMVGGGTIIGAGLGLLVGLTDKLIDKVNRNNTVDVRLMKTVVDNLKRANFREGIDFTRDPKVANDLKVKVCILITKVSNNLQLLVNTISDSKLKSVTDDMVKHIPNNSVVTKQVSDRFNDITISTISDSSADAGLVTGIAEYFIRHKYPVYLVEVG